jgi:proteasome lid subunit RPN8/RPN11
MIRLSKATEQSIRQEGELAYPNECCGILLGSSDAQGVAVVDQILPIENGREQEEQYHRFVITADDYLRADRVARQQGMDVIGFYHSHPDHPAVPSEFDRIHALPFYAYIIVAVAKQVSGALTSSRLTPDRQRFLQEEIDIS